MQKAVHDGIWIRQERGVRGLAGVCDGVLTQHGRKLLLNVVEQSTVILTVKVHALHILPGLVGDFVPEHLGGLVLELGNSGLLQVGRHIVIKDLFGSFRDDTFTLCQSSVTRIVPMSTRVDCHLPESSSTEAAGHPASSKSTRPWA